MGPCSSKSMAAAVKPDLGKNSPNSPVHTFANASEQEKAFQSQYTLKEELGSGAHSVVKLAEHKQTKDTVAVKIVSAQNLSTQDQESIDLEIEVLGALHHPHVIELIEVFRGDKEYYIITELVQGGELFDRIVNKNFYSEYEARELIKLFISTIEYIHSRDICHRDLKPENLLLVSEEDDSNLKIADFGYAKRITSLKEEPPCGTPGYVAPEILRGDEYGAEVDIWSMGVICYVLLAGYPPFYDEDTKKIYRKIKAGKYHFHQEHWAGISDGAKDLITKMLTVDQKERWTAKQLLDHPWITNADKNALSARGLDNTIVNLKKFNARKKFRAAAQAVIVTNRMGALFANKGLGPAAENQIKPLSLSFSGGKSILDIKGEDENTTFDMMKVEGDHGIAVIDEQPENL